MKKTLLTLLATVAVCTQLSAGFGFFWHSEPCYPTVVVATPRVCYQGYYVRHRAPSRELFDGRREPVEVRGCPVVRERIATRTFGY